MEIDLGYSFPECIYCDDRAVTSVIRDGLDGSVGLAYMCQHHFEIHCKDDPDNHYPESDLWD
jgi:hypothetical protein